MDHLEPQKLTRKIVQLVNNLPAQTSFYARHLSLNTEIAISADLPVNTLSVIKIAVMVLAYLDSEVGSLDLDQRYRIRPEDLRQGSGLLQTFRPGLMPTYRDLVTQMIITSDNTATDILINKLGIDRVNQMLLRQGYQNTRLQMTTGELFRQLWAAVDPESTSWSPIEHYHRGLPFGPKTQNQVRAFLQDPSRWLGQTTAREITRVLEQILRGEIASEESCREMLAILRGQWYNTRMPRRIGMQVRVAHKTGDWPPYAGHDVGVIEAPSGPILLALFIWDHQAEFYRLEETHGQVAEALLTAWG